MTTNIRSLPQNQAFGRTLPIALAILVWVFAAAIETGYVAVLDSGIQHVDPARELA